MKSLPIIVALFCAISGRAQFTVNTVPTREIGQPQMSDPFVLPNGNPNLVEGRELFYPEGIALDTSVTPPRLYVADTVNNRILAWKNARGFNNGDHADLVIGQYDFFSTGANGPSVSGGVSTGFNQPTGLAVDYLGNLYVADSGNNRVLRFLKPFDTTPLKVDLWIGQKALSSSPVVNYPSGQAVTPTANGISLSSFVVAITFDSKHNLWLTDAGNSRVLRYPAAVVTNAKSGSADTISADLVIGQGDFNLKYPPLTPAQAGQLKDQLAIPSAIAFDNLGRLYIADSDGNTINRVLVFEPPFQQANSTWAHAMGILPTPITGAQPMSDVDKLKILMFNPSAIFFVPGATSATQGIGVVDGYSRILIFDPYNTGSWLDSTLFSPAATYVYGHSTTIANQRSTPPSTSLYPNDGSQQSAANTLSRPQAAVFDDSTSQLYVADTSNNRVIVLPWQSGKFSGATQVLGQNKFTSNSINLIEGREFFFFNGRLGDAAVVMDSTGDTPHLYVSDPYNNRVLGFRDVRKLVPGSAADIVIGQPDMFTAACNYPTDPTRTDSSHLCHPIGLTVDATGNLYVADSANGRVLRFLTPFSHVGNQQADVVLGQSDFTSSPITDATPYNMATPYGLAFAGPNATVGLLVSDVTLNRVLFFPFTNGTFTSADNGKAATKVLGQQTFLTHAAGTSATGMWAPHHIAVDTSGQVYVADTPNNRVLIFPNIANSSSTGGFSAFPQSAPNATGIFVDPGTGEILVTTGGTVIKFPSFGNLIIGQGTVYYFNDPDGPIAITQDQDGDLIVAEALNRVAFFYPKLAASNTANGLSADATAPVAGLAPNTMATIYGKFGTGTASAYDLPQPIPLPTTLADIQVTVDGTAAPLYYVSPGQINFVVPWSARTAGNAGVEVLKVSTGQLLAAGPIKMTDVSPAIFVTSSVGAGVKLAAVVNQDGTVNDAAHPAKVGQYISIYATGQGVVSSPPADGDIPRNGLVGSQITPRVFIGSAYTDEIPLQSGEQRNANGDVNFISFSGLSPSIPGMWQVNVRIPQATATGAQALGLVLGISPDNLPAATGYRIVFYVTK
jgi:uncharacterized protein (TIGR03437 family)